MPGATPTLAADPAAQSKEQPMDTLNQVMNSSNGVVFFVVGGAFLVAIIGIVSNTISCIAKSRAREQSRREIAAYIAEGSISPAEGERLMTAGKKA
jgi:hypothetical protein